MFYHLTKFQCHIIFFFSTSIKQSFDDIINFKIYLRSSSEAMADREGKTEIQKSENHENEKSILDEIESTFYNYLRAFIW